MGEYRRDVPDGVIQRAKTPGTNRPLFAKWLRDWDKDARAALGRDIKRLAQRMRETREAERKERDG